MTAKTTVQAEMVAGAASHDGLDGHAIDWRRVHQTVRRLQARIVKAIQEGRWGKVRALQHLLTHSFSAKTLAVRRVTENQGKRTPGVDRVTWETPAQKATAIGTLRQRGYRPQPLRRVYIAKSNGKLRGLGIPTMRDRSSTYAEGARHGAPSATQVADRFHLLHNLAQALDEVFTTQSKALAAVNAAMRQQPVPLLDGTVAVPVPPPATPPRAQQQAAQRAAHRQATYDQVWALHHQGWTVPALAAQVGHSRHTIERYLRLPTWPAPQHRSTYGRSVLNPYKAYLLERWNAGCRTATQLFRELQPRGYTGSYRRVAAYVSRLRQAQGLAPRRQGRRQTLPKVAEPTCPPLTPRRATWLVLQREAKRTADETRQLTQLHAQSAEVAEAIDLAQDFATLLRQRQPASLDPWLRRATTSALSVLQRFAQGLYQDYHAVKAGVTVPWSNGPVEGHINRLKMLKRQMFGRARLDLLSHRFLRAPREGQALAPSQRAPAPAPAVAKAA